MSERADAQAAQSECGHFMRAKLIEEMKRILKELKERKI